MKKSIFLFQLFWFFFLHGRNSTCIAKLDSSVQDIPGNYIPYAQQDNLRINDSIRSRVLAEEKLRIAKISERTDEIYDAYYELATLVQEKDAIRYADSIIALTRNTENFNYPARAYLFKAKLYGARGRYQLSMDELVKANRYANLNKNIDQQYETKYYIAVLQGNLGNHQEALNLLQSITTYYKEKNANNTLDYQEFYIKSLFALGNSYNYNEDYDRASLTNKKAIALSLKTKDSVLYPHILLNSGTTHFLKKEYRSSIDSLLKLKDIILKQGFDTSRWIITDLTLGKNYFEQGQIEDALRYFEVVDSTAFANKFFEPTMQSMYETMIGYYKEKEDVENQLFYIDRLLALDSILDEDFKYLYEQIDKKYYTPNLILEKQAVIDSLEKEKRSTAVIVIVLAVLSGLLLLFLFQNVRKKRIYKQRFTELLEKTNKARKTKQEDTGKSTSMVNRQMENQGGIGISKIIINDILKNLRLFEENQSFIASNITVSILAKEFKTNSKYLSKVINIYKEKSFSNYINDLRIDFVIEKLKTDEVFRRYTIKAIAMEVGFNTAEAFSKSFFKSTGIYPSFFLKELEKVVVDENRS
ncbi:helix-turn-helix domain-containing protein [Spongiimicrobium salis]|uniref:helix-turn-helix domain-containing protein n=1 Tax=Spongiimicrobium salis TaxID=1667022 RepID=UPI00374D02F2